MNDWLNAPTITKTDLNLGPSKQGDLITKPSPHYEKKAAENSTNTMGSGCLQNKTLSQIQAPILSKGGGRTTTKKDGKLGSSKQGDLITHLHPPCPGPEASTPKLRPRSFDPEASTPKL